MGMADWMDRLGLRWAWIRRIGMAIRGCIEYRHERLTFFARPSLTIQGLLHLLPGVILHIRLSFKSYTMTSALLASKTLFGIGDT